MKKKILVVILALLFLIPDHAQAWKIVDNLQPRAELDLTVEPLQRKVDILIDNDMLSPSWTELEQLVDDELIPMLEEDNIDYRITYTKPSNYRRDPLFFKGGYINHRNQLYLASRYRSDPYNLVDVPNNAFIVSATSQGYMLDDQGTLYCYRPNENSTYQKVEIDQTDTEFIKLKDAGRYTYGLTDSGLVYLIKPASYYNVCGATFTQIENLVDIVDLDAGRYEDRLIAVDSAGYVYGVGADMYNPNDPSNNLNGGRIEGLSNIKQVAVIDGDYNSDGKRQQSIFALTYDGEVYSWGNFPLGREADRRNYRDPYSIKRIPHDEKIARMQADFSTSLHGSDYYTTEEVFLISEGGIPYTVYENGLGYRYVTNIYTYFSRERVHHNGVHAGSRSVVVVDQRERLETTLNKTTWRKGAEKYYLHLTANLDEQIAEKTDLFKIANKLISEKIHYIGLSAHTDIVRKLVAANDYKGKAVEKTPNLPLNFRHIAQYIVKNQSMDVVFHIANTAHDDIKGIEPKLRDYLVPYLEQYGINVRLSVFDGVRIPDDRIYYYGGSNQIYVYDPQDNSRRMIVSRSVSSAMIHHSGDLFYLGRGTSNVYRYNTKTGEETLYTVLPDMAVRDEMAVDRDGYVWFQQSEVIFMIGTQYNMMKYDPKTESLERIRSNTYIPFYALTPGAQRDVIFKASYYTGSAGDFIAYPTGSPSYTSQFAQSSSGCIYYNYTVIGSQYNPIMGGTCGASFRLISTPGGPAGDGNGFIYNTRGIIGNPDGIYLYENGRHRTLIEGEQGVFLTTPAGKAYYERGGRTRWIEWETGERGTLPFNLSPGSLIKYHYHNIDTRRLRRIPLSEGIETQVWRTNTDAYYVYLNDDTIPGLNNLADRLWEDKVSLVALGTDSNRDQIESFGELVNNHGTFIDNTNIDDAIAELAAYLINQAGLPKYSTKDEKVILEYIDGTYQSGNLIWNDNYEDIENDPKHEERWIFNHNPNVYENPLGQLPEHGQLLSSPITTLTRTGLYNVNYEVSDLPKDDPRFDNFIRWSEPAKLSVYAHRRPIADFIAKVERQNNNDFYSLTVIDQSYDLDRQNTPNRGIVEHQWRWKTYDDLEWTAGVPPTSIKDDVIYVIALRVKDTDGAWSEEKILLLLAVNHNNPPVARFTVTSPIINDQEYVINDQSYDPDDDPIVEWAWEVIKDGKSIYASSSRPTAATLRSRASSNGLSPYGIYTMILMVRDDPQTGLPLWSEPYQQTLEIIHNIPPVPGFNWSPTLLYQGDSVQFKHQVDDHEKATLRVRYEVTAPNGSVTYYPSSSGWYNVPEENYNSNAFSMNNLIGGDYTILQTVRDEYSTRTLTKNMHVIPNRPPEPGFSWTPTIIWEGDTVQLRHDVFDADNDTLQIRYRVTAPNGSVTFYPSSSGWYTVNPASYESNAFQLTNVIPGTYSVLQTVSDNKAPAVTLSQTFLVGELTINGYVKHTEDWDKNRKLYNQKQTGTDDSPRTYDTFWAGEAFVLEADTTDTQGSSTTAQWVRVTLLETGDSTMLSSNDGLNWQGELAKESYQLLEDGNYNFRFEVMYDGPVSGGVIKTDIQTIRIVDNVFDFFRIHRIN